MMDVTERASLLMYDLTAGTHRPSKRDSIHLSLYTRGFDPNPHFRNELHTRMTILVCYQDVTEPPL